MPTHPCPPEAPVDSGRPPVQENVGTRSPSSANSGDADPARSTGAPSHTNTGARNGIFPYVAARTFSLWRGLRRRRQWTLHADVLVCGRRARRARVYGSASPYLYLLSRRARSLSASSHPCAAYSSAPPRSSAPPLTALHSSSRSRLLAAPQSASFRRRFALPPNMRAMSSSGIRNSLHARI